MARAYTAKDIQSIRDDRSRMRAKPTIYIPSTYKDGAIHIIFEIVDNAIDELSIKESVGSNLILTFDTKTKEVTVIDDGRGIPHGALLDSCTVLNTSGKFNNGEDSAYTYSGGINGCGLKCAVFLSKQCEVTSIRDGESLSYKFDDGFLVDTVKSKSKDHGTIAKFTIDKKLIDIGEVTADDIKERLIEKSYCFPEIRMTFTVLENGKEKKTYTYFGNTLVDLVKKQKPDTEMIHIQDTRKVKTLRNITDDDITTVCVVVDSVIAYKEDALDADTDAYITSYANSIKTYDGGMHVEGLKLGLVKFFKEVLIPKASKKDKDLPITPTDITSGLCGVVRVMISKPEFSAQHKSRLTNQEVKFAVRDAVFEALCNQKPSVTKAMEEFVHRVTKGRMASKKTRRKDVDNAFSNDRPDKYTPIIYNIKTVAPELILTEGDSAAGLAAAARDAYNQGIYSVKKPKNIFDVSSESITRGVRTVFNDIMDICGIEPGKKCDPDKCQVRLILLLTDGDVDGDAIAIGVLCLIAKHCRPLIDAGMVGRILPPAYSFPDGKKKRFIRSKREFFELIMKKFVKDVTIGVNGKEMSKNELYAFLSNNFDYDKKLEALADWQCCEPKFMEYIAWKYHGDAKSQKKSYWMQALKRYSDLKVLVEGGTVVIDGDMPGADFVNLAFDEHFDRRVKKFKVQQANNSQIDNYSINGKGDKTLYDVMHLFRSYMPKGVERYKGLGELEVKELEELCMNREKRTVIIFKFKDFEQDMEKISVIMSTKAEYAAARAKIMSSLRLDDLDLDT